MGASVQGEEDEVVSAVDESMVGGSTTSPGQQQQQQQEMVAVTSAEGENFKRQDSSRDKAYRLWSKVKYQLVKFEALPEHLRDNEYILGHYRANWPLGPTLLSIFSFHNETLNIWTHLLGFLLFLGLTIFTVSKLPRYVEPCIEQLLRMRTGIITSLPSYLHLPHCLDSSSLSGTGSSENCSKHVTRWPFFVFLGGAMFCLLSSTTCHLFSCISARWSSLLLRLDYIGIALLIASSFYPPVLHHYLHENSSSSGLIQHSGWLHVFFLGFCTNLSSAVQEPANRSQKHCCLMLYIVGCVGWRQVYYSFACSPFLRNMYLCVITTIAIGTVVVSLLPVFQTSKYRTFRASLFFGMGISGVVPCIHKLFLYKESEPVLYQTLYLEVLMGLLYGLGALVYATRIPERWKPGMFDIFGNSHQLFHVLVVAGAYTHYESGLLYLKWRDVKGCDTW